MMKLFFVSEKRQCRTMMSVTGILMMAAISLSVGCSNKSIDTKASVIISKQSKIMIPFLQKNGLFRYVDEDLKPVIDKEFSLASKFSPKGYAFVYDKDFRQGIIDVKGNFIRDFSDKTYETYDLGTLTFIEESREYEKKLPVWKWDWNIMGSGIDKTATFSEVTISVLQTGQKIASKTTNKDEYEEGISLDVSPLDDSHFVMNEKLYEIKGNKVKEIADKIYFTFTDDQVLVSEKNGNALFYSFDGKLKNTKELKPVKEISIQANGKTIVLDSLNETRYRQRPANATLLKDIKTNEIFPYPNFDKAFPVIFSNLSDGQVSFLNKVTLISSVNKTPYFILGTFNYDKWKYDYKYVDAKGNFLPSIQAPDFFILGNVGEILWPESDQIISPTFIEEGYQVKKIKKVYGQDSLFFVQIEKNNVAKKGLWNSKKQQWIIPAEFDDIGILDEQNLIVSLRMEKDEGYYLYDARNRKRITHKTYKSIFADGLITNRTGPNKEEKYYIDIFTGKEFKE